MLSLCLKKNLNVVMSTFILFFQFVARTFSVACNSDAEIFAAIQRVETVVRTQRHLLDAGMFPMLSVGWTWQEFCHDLKPCWFK